MGGRIVVLASGSGTNCQALLDACASGLLDAQVVAVISNNADARVLARADAAAVPARVIDHRGSDPDIRRESDQRLIELIAEFEPNLVVLAGWMRILGRTVGEAFPIINLHPAKPGEFPGTGAIERAFQAWSDGAIVESGVMVHWVPDEGVDVGPAITSDVVPFESGDSLESFAERMHAAEHRLIVVATAAALTSLS